jgi:hypothetical protein
VRVRVGAPAAPADHCGDACSCEPGGAARDSLADPAHSIDVSRGDVVVPGRNGSDNLRGLNEERFRYELAGDKCGANFVGIAVAVDLAEVGGLHSGDARLHGEKSAGGIELEGRKARVT